jgi:hypothetical protein
MPVEEEVINSFSCWNSNKNRKGPAVAVAWQLYSLTLRDSRATVTPALTTALLTYIFYKYKTLPALSPSL